MWNSKKIGSPRIEFGYGPKELVHNQKGQAIEATVCKKYKTVNNEVIIKVTKDKRVYYRVSNAKKGPWSYIFEFFSKTTGDFSFLAVGDTNLKTEDGLKMPSFLKKFRSDLFLHLGDVAYDQGKRPEEWDNVGKAMEPISSTRPLQHVVGNHDAHCDEKYEQFLFRFSKLPGKNSRGGNVFYSFDFSHVHFVILSTESVQSLKEDSIQHNWLKSDLKNVDRKKTPWVIVSHHQPPYSPNGTGEEELRKILDPLYEKHNVDIVLVGHVHVYGRSCQALYGKCQQKGPIHLNLGTGGADFKQFRDLPTWTRMREYIKGIGKFEVTKKRIDFSFVGVNDKIIDKYTFSK
eukprot:gene32-4283_t